MDRIVVASYPFSWKSSRAADRMAALEASPRRVFATAMAKT